MSQSYRPLLALAALGLCAAPLAAQGFEGVVTWKVTAMGRDMTQYYKGSQVRTEMEQEGHHAVMLMDNASSKWTMIVPEQKMYMTMDFKTMSERAKGMKKDELATAQPKVTKTGKTETIAGRTCEVYDIQGQNDPETMEVCAVHGMGYFLMGSANPMARRPGPNTMMTDMAQNPAFHEMFKDGFFPLKVTRIQGGKSEVMMVATSITPKSVDASEFTVPAGYTEMRMPMMPQRP